jgi:2-phospho-L-lactate guanylyltransferase
VAIVPIRSFIGMTRLSDALDPDERSRLARNLASGVFVAAATAGLRILVITSDTEVAAWSGAHGASVCDDPGTGLSGAARAGVSMSGSSPWLVIHADLPLVTPKAIETVATACESTAVVVPSYDGGTTVLGGRGEFPFSYGPGSFQRHYASAPNATIIVSPELSIDIDTPRHLGAFIDLAGD